MGFAAILALSVLAVPANAEKSCLCKQYKCTWQGKDHVYRLANFKGEEIQWCIQNQTRIFKTAGDCLYNCMDCENDICVCKGAMECDWTMNAAAVLCFIASAVCFCCCARSCWRYPCLHQVMDEEEAERYIE